MTVDEWKEKEKEYQEAIRDINITPNISTQDIKILISKLDDVYSKAYTDFSRARTAHERVQRQNRVLNRTLFLQAKSGSVPELNARPSDEVCKSYAETEMAIPREEGQMSPLDIEHHTLARFNFMSAVIEILNAKRQMLITDQAVLKLEASLQ